ncbi:hypothetical protein SLEP1_g36125 [Rubroshorea leprosula]|uniref:Wall-associated receptor kinase galacturonan-binding domain-containing protein n=1 Tax=Rubroshorea leprosula TaxID=152421 RepID=A0AAV5KQS6_9ROSI|nr:hypothetical protein SLEP1_g36125 [Rubroshorea leprosula]
MMIIRTSSIFAFLALLMIESAADQALVKHGCQEFCGDVSIPYPFGIGKDCYMKKQFEVSCHNAHKPPKIFLTSAKIEVLCFSLDPTFIVVKLPTNCTNCNRTLAPLNLAGSPFITVWSALDLEEYVPGVLEWAITDADVSQLPHTNENAFNCFQFNVFNDTIGYGRLNGEEPISLARAEGGRSLASHFIHSMEENGLFSILDARVRESSAHEEITKVAKLAHRCLSLNGKRRPKMIEVAAELEQIRLLQNNSNGQQNHEEVTYVKSEVTNLWDGTSTSIGSGLDSGASLSIDMQPLISNKSQGFN